MKWYPDILTPFLAAWKWPECSITPFAFWKCLAFSSASFLDLHCMLWHIYSPLGPTLLQQQIVYFFLCDIDFAISPIFYPIFAISNIPPTAIIPVATTAPPLTAPTANPEATIASPTAMQH